MYIIIGGLNIGDYPNIANCQCLLLTNTSSSYMVHEKFPGFKIYENYKSFDMNVCIIERKFACVEHGTANVEVFIDYVTAKLFSFKSVHIYGIVTQYNKYC